MLCNFKCSFVIFFSSFRKWKDALREAEVPFQEKFLPYAMSPYLRSQVSISEAKMTTQNLSILSALDDPILIIDPYQISLEYLELLHVDDKITMLHIGGDFLLNNLKKLEMTCSIAFFFLYLDPCKILLFLFQIQHFEHNFWWKPKIPMLLLFFTPHLI